MNKIIIIFKIILLSIIIVFFYDHTSFLIIINSKNKNDEIFEFKKPLEGKMFRVLDERLTVCDPVKYT